ncbi:MAG: methyltransferase [Tannerellaceae bacterium]|nr:methyltransferase [Tannerellaceae bacterium]
METIEVLRNATVEGKIVKLPDVKLERNEYLEVAKQLNLIGGKWKGGKIQGFVFEFDPTEMLAQITDGEKRNLKKEFQFFETPPSLAKRLVDMARIKVFSRILEPSAGRGEIVKAIMYEWPVPVYGYELMDINKTFLKEIPDFVLLGSDFLIECNDERFDRIIANPPFSQNQDINHIRKMYDCLNPGGRLVSVASKHWRLSNGKKEEAFRVWLTEVGAQVEGVEAGTFKDSGTAIETCIIVINK